MPSWSIHLKVGKELNKKLDLDKDAFLFGSLLPDTDSSWKLNRFYSHYYGNLRFSECPHEYMIDMDSFFNDYKNKLNNPLVIGYLCHLLTDHYFNEYIYTNKWVQDDDHNIIGIKGNNGIININNQEETLIYKHSDLELYGKRLMEQEDIPIPEDSDVLFDSIYDLKDEFLNPLQVIDRLDYLSDGFIDFNEISDEERNKEYMMFTKEELDNLVIGCIDYIFDRLKELGLYESNHKL